MGDMITEIRIRWKAAIKNFTRRLPVLLKRNGVATEDVLAQVKEA